MTTAPQSPGSKSSKLMWGIAAGFTLPIIIFLTAVGVPGFQSFRARQWSAEAKLNVRQLCRLTLRLHERERVWREAGPLPDPMPKGGERVLFGAYKAFTEIGFTPHKVRYQYEVKLQREGEKIVLIRCMARGDQDGDGVLATFAVGVIPESKELTAIDITDELE